MSAHWAVAAQVEGESLRHLRTVACRAGATARERPCGPVHVNCPYREPLLRQLVLTDGHSPSEYRADVPRNLDAWYAAFNVQAGQKLYLPPGDRVRVW